MPDEIWLDRQAGVAFKKKLELVRGYFEEEKRGLGRAEGLAGSLYYASMVPPIRDTTRATEETIGKLVTLQLEYEKYETAIEEFDREAARLLSNIPEFRGIVSSSWSTEPLEIDASFLSRILGGGQASYMAVRATFETRSDVEKVDWERTADGKSIITITFNDGRSPQILKEGEDYYIKDGTSYFYNNIRTLLEAHGAKVDWQKTPGGGSTIDLSLPVKMPAGTEFMALATLVEGKDYFIDKNGKAHFKDMTYGPVPPVDSQSGAKGNGIQGSAKATSMMGYLNKVAGEDAKDWGSGTGTQCVELPKHYIETVWGFKTKEMGLGNGKDMYYMIPNAFPDTFEKIDYSDNFVPQVGDIISLRGSDKNKTLYGHAAIVTSVSGNEVTIVDQWEDYDGDASNNKVREITFTITGNIASANSDSFYDIYGVARPK